jgi:hypothetical protein
MPGSSRWVLGSRTGHVPHPGVAAGRGRWRDERGDHETLGESRTGETSASSIVRVVVRVFRTAAAGRRQELREATTSLSIREVTERPLRVTPKLVRQTIDEMTGILEHAPLDTRVAWVRDLFERIDVDSRESHAVAVWKAVTDEGV